MAYNSNNNSSPHPREQMALPSIREMFPEYISSHPIGMEFAPRFVPPAPPQPQQHYRDPVSSVSLTHIASSHPRSTIPNITHYRACSTGAESSPAEIGAAEEVEDGDSETGGRCDLKRHVCVTCGKGFNRPSSLQIHANTHSGAQPFLCPYPACGRSFNVNSNMRRHFRNHGVPLSPSVSPHSLRAFRVNSPVQVHLPLASTSSAPAHTFRAFNAHASEDSNYQLYSPASASTSPHSPTSSPSPVPAPSAYQPRSASSLSSRHDSSLSSNHYSPPSEYSRYALSPVSQESWMSATSPQGGIAMSRSQIGYSESDVRSERL
ncbi:hypothetical protein C8R43DRAFT_1110167 [Mycena crocata]|nr:hypothetical protein C8R43DRAFT_1110167 [Mycena crocata]